MALTTKHYSHSSDAAVGAIIELVDSLRSGLMFKDITKDAHINKEFLVGGKHKVLWGAGGFREGVLMISGHLHIFFRLDLRISGLQDFSRS